MTRPTSFFALFIAATTLLIATAHARSPAVLPVTELSIEEYKQIGPNEAKSPGYDFSGKGTATVLVPVESGGQDIVAEATSENTIITQAIEHHAIMNLRSLSVYLIILMMSLPALAWLYMSKRPQQEHWPQAPERNAHTTLTDLSNVTTLPKRAQNSDKGDDHDVKKAS